MRARMPRGRLPLSEANHRGTLATSETSKHSALAMMEKSGPTTVVGDASKPTPALLLKHQSRADTNSVTVLHARPPLPPRASSCTATDDSRDSIFVDLTSETANSCSNSSKTG